jgi:alkylation response protein AidB-like acyl-CoA dehydrogenase
MLETVEAIKPLLQASAMEGNRIRRLPDAVADAFRSHGLWKLWVPAELGGAELALPESLRVFEAASRIDGSIGWSLAIGVGGGLFAAYLGEPAAAEIFAPEESLIAGSGAASGALHRVEGGYRVSGTWRYASGIHHATWVTANTLVGGGGEPAEPRILAVAVPASEVEVLDTWHTVAMRGTGSHDVAMRDLPVEEAFTFSLAEPPRIGRPLYRFPFANIAELSFAAVSLGIARGGIDAFLAGAGQRDTASGKVLDQAAARARLARAEGELRGARALLYDAAQSAWREVESGAELGPKHSAEVTLAAVQASRAAMSALDALMDAAGMSPLYEDDRFGRCWRDLRATRQHVMLSATREAEIGATLLGQ